MSTNDAISVAIEDEDGNLHELLNNMIDFERIRLEEEKVLPIVLHNKSGYVVQDITVQATAHPTAQIGRAADTYLATTLGETESGPWYNLISINSMSVNEKITLYVNWTIPADSLLGTGQFAIEVRGDVIL
ncbi:MAG: hypothetical protein DRP09_13505 [Candidatus Thorarchaeota archaeon]|nr:MAG: hypothetical protein DRP09_13505 [Candidatus Thorarchaeota archaeon]